MSQVAEIFQRYGPAYQAQYGQRMLPSHWRTMRDIQQCRTEACGGHLYRCPGCHDTRYRYHSCKNRHCPKCQHDEGQQWLARQQAFLLPVPYFLVTFTLPANLRLATRQNQTVFYNLLFRTSATALQELAWDPRFVGGQIGMVGVLHTWGRNLSYHPHVHYLVPAGGLSADGQRWLAGRHNFLVPVRALSRLFRGKFRAALQRAGLLKDVPEEAWQREWVVHCKPVGNGVAALKYLAPYIFRVAISNKRILRIDDDKVTFRYRVSDTGQHRVCTLDAGEFIRRFLQHVLPRRFVKVRYYGLFSPGLRHKLTLIRLWLDRNESAKTEEDQAAVSTQTQSCNDDFRCPTCGQVMQLMQRIRPRRGPP